MTITKLRIMRKKRDNADNAVFSTLFYRTFLRNMIQFYPYLMAIHFQMRYILEKQKYMRFKKI